MIKKYVGIVGFFLGFIGIMISFTYSYFYETNLEPLAETSFFVWITTMTISTEMNKEKRNILPLN